MEETHLALWLQPNGWGWKLHRWSSKKVSWFWVSLERIRDFKRERFQIVREWGRDKSFCKEKEEVEELERECKDEEDEENENKKNGR